MSARRRSSRLRKLHNNRNKNNHNNHNHEQDEDEDIDLPSSTTNNSPQSTSITTNNLPPKSPNPDNNHNHSHQSSSSSQREQEDEQSLPHNNTGQETPENSEEKELSTSSSTTSTSQQLSYCRGLSRTPLSVPMVAEINQQSVTRNDAKAITETRLKRLKELSQRPEQTLSKDQKDEKKRIIRLEKNRRAAAMSRRKKKMYVKNLEEKTHLMARHLAILEMENSHLRALLQAAQQTNIQSPAAMVGLPAFKLPNLPQFQLPSLSQFNHNGMKVNRNNSEVINHSLSATATTTTTTTTSNTSKNESVDVVSSSNEPSLKKRRLNDGSSVNENISNSLSPSCEHSSDIDILEPLPLPILSSNNNKGNEMVLPPPPPPPPSAPSVPALPVGFMSGHHLLPPNMANIHPSRLMPPHLVRNHGNKRQRLRATDVLPKIDKMDKIEAIVIDKDDDEEDDEDGNAKTKESVKGKIKRNEEEGKSMEEMENHGNTQNIPPPVVIPRLSNEFMTLLDDDDIMNQAVNECDGVLQFGGDIKTNNAASYL